jgi:hypothetical protein
MVDSAKCWRYGMNKTTQVPAFMEQEEINQTILQESGKV